MSCSYNVVLRQVMLRINALTGATATLLESAYTTSPLTTTQAQSTIFNFTAIKDAVLSAEEALAWAIANVAEQPLRQYLANTTANLASPATLPSVSTDSKPIIGIWGAVRDASSGIVCSELPLDLVRRRAASTSLVCPVYWYSLTGGRIEHTRTNVVIECCTYSRSDQSTIFDANGNILLSDALEPAYVNGALSMLVRDDEFMSQANVFSGYFAAAIDGIAKGLTTVQGTATAA